MDESVMRSLAKWPNVPAVYGWLGLNRRGEWILDNEPLRHERARSFICRNYQADDDGCWYFQNGPQRVYVALEYTPIVVHLLDGVLHSHLKQRVERIEAAFLDDLGNIVLTTDQGPALLDPQSLLEFSELLRDTEGNLAGDETIEQVLEGRGDLSSLRFNYADCSVALAAITATELPARLGFVPQPRPPGTDSPDRCLSSSNQ